MNNINKSAPPGFQRRLALGAVFFICAALIMSCTGQSTARPAADQPAPTVAPIFQSSGQLQPTPALLPSPGSPTATPLPGETLDRVGPPGTHNTPESGDEENGRDLMAASVALLPVFDESLAEGWTLERSWDMRIDPASKIFIYQGTVALAATPTASYGGLFFSVTPEGGLTLLRSRVVGLRFQVTGGSEYLKNDALIVSVIGSNRHRFWARNDDSVSYGGYTSPGTPLFPETRLYFLNINQDIPPRTWTEVELILDEHNPPEYRYVTGILIKNDEAYRGTYYIDNLSLIMERE